MNLTGIPQTRDVRERGFDELRGRDLQEMTLLTRLGLAGCHTFHGQLQIGQGG